MDDNAIDSAIDDVAKEMTAGELHASFRARISSNIRTESSRGEPPVSPVP